MRQTCVLPKKRTHWLWTGLEISLEISPLDSEPNTLTNWSLHLPSYLFLIKCKNFPFTFSNFQSSVSSKMKSHHNGFKRPGHHSNQHINSHNCNQNLIDAKQRNSCLSSYLELRLVNFKCFQVRQTEQRPKQALHALTHPTTQNFQKSIS